MAHGLGAGIDAGGGVVAGGQLDRLVGAGRCPRWHGRPPQLARLEDHVDLDRRVAARIEDLSAMDTGDAGRHRSSSSISLEPSGPASPISSTTWSTAPPLPPPPLSSPTLSSHPATPP